MDKPWSVIWALESHPSRINKEQIVEVQAQEGNSEFFEGCRLALSSHGVMLTSYPPQDAWKFYGVEEKARAAINAVEKEE